jgi:hypothetical protein
MGHEGDLWTLGWIVYWISCGNFYKALTYSPFIFTHLPLGLVHF